METRELSRRDFARLAGAGLFVFFDSGLAQEPNRIPRRVSAPTNFNAFLKIGEDGRVECLVGKVELGQGAMTSLAQVLAEELDVAFDSVDVVMGDTNLCPYDMGTFGSMTTPFLVPPLRKAAAEARAVLLAMAAERLGAPVERLRVKNGVVTDSAGAGPSVSYARLVEGKRIEKHLAEYRRQAGRRVSDHRAIAAPQGRAGQGDREGALRGRPTAGRPAARVRAASAGARRKVPERGHLGGREGARRAGGERWRSGGRAPRAARRGRGCAREGEGRVRFPAGASRRKDDLRPPPEDRAAASSGRRERRPG